MTILIGFAGLVAGFLAGQILLMFMLRHKSNQDIKMERKSLHIYGLLNWAVALMGCAAFLYIHNKYF